MDSEQSSWPKSRQHPRRNAEVPLVVRLASESYRGWTTDVGMGGLGLTVAAEIAVGADIAVEFTPPNGTLVKARAVIRYRKGFKYGAEFLMITPSDLEMIKRYVLAVSQV